MNEEDLERIAEIRSELDSLSSIYDRLMNQINDHEGYVEELERELEELGAQDFDY